MGRQIDVNVPKIYQLGGGPDALRESSASGLSVTDQVSPTSRLGEIHALLDDQGYMDVGALDLVPTETW